jgi:hypothetical protein
VERQVPRREGRIHHARHVIGWHVT